MTTLHVMIRGGRDEVIESRARKAGLVVSMLDAGETPALPGKMLIVQAGTRVPWDLLPAAWHFLDRWDAAVPLWRYGVLAADVGTAEEREATRLVVGDLRLLLHSCELLFVKGNEASQQLVATWLADSDENERLAFLRAVYQVKPRLCVLPTTWLAEVRQYQAPGSPRRKIAPARPLATVEIAPGRRVKVHADDVERIKAQTFMNGRNIMAIVSSKSFVINNQKTRAAKGPLVRVKLSPGRYVKMYEADAIAAGHLPPKAAPKVEKPKGKPAQENKGRRPEGDKVKVADVPLLVETAVKETAVASAESGASAEAGDDFTTIGGIGKATARLLAAHGIVTFDELREAATEGQLSFMSSQQQQAIETWKEETDG